MKIGMIGLGRMGANMTLRILNASLQVVAFDRHRERVERLVKHGALGAMVVEELVAQLEPPRAVWLKAAIDESVPAPILSTADMRHPTCSVAPVREPFS